MPEAERGQDGDVAKDDVTIAARVPPDLDGLLECLVETGALESKSDLIRRALRHYLEKVVDPAVIRAAQGLLEARRRAVGELEALAAA